MTTTRGARVGEVHHSACRATIQEPPTRDTLPPPDRGAPGHGSPNAWGKVIEKKQPQTMRFCFQNVDGISHLSDGDGLLKLHALLQFTINFQVDVFTAAELNTCWDLLPPDQRLASLTKGWWENSHWCVSHNRREESPSVYQPGGTALVVTNKLSHRALKPGDDPLGLGRWCWIKLRGTNSHHVRIVSMYRPCKADGILTSYQQHLRTLGKLKCDICPKKAILDDLATEITTWQEAGDIVIVAADFNEDTRSDTIRSYFSQFGMSEVLSSVNTEALPASHNRGSLPIDGIFAPDAIIPFCRAGFLGFGEGVPSDHRAAWIDIPLPVLHLSSDTNTAKAQARRLQCADPRVVLQYNTLLHERLTTSNALSRVKALTDSITGTRLTKAQQAEYETLDNIVIDAKRFAERHCQKIKAGKIPWCPQVSRCMNRILYWKGLLCRIQGACIGLSVLRTWAKKAGILHSQVSLAIPIETLHSNIAAAYRAFSRI